jgi:hypothetical protein
VYVFRAARVNHTPTEFKTALPKAKNRRLRKP